MFVVSIEKKKSNKIIFLENIISKLNLDIELHEETNSFSAVKNNKKKNEIEFYTYLIKKKHAVKSPDLTKEEKMFLRGVAEGINFIKKQ